MMQTMSRPTTTATLKSARPLHNLRTARRIAAAVSRRATVRCLVADSTLVAAKKQMVEVIKEHHCAPIMVRLAWHDSGNYDATLGTGGANGSIR